MAGLVKHSQNEVLVSSDFDKTFQACVFSGERIGKVKQQSKTLGHISINIPASLFPPRNATNLKISIKPTDGGCIVSCVAESFDGLVGVGSAHKSIDAFYNVLTSYLSI